MPAADERTRQRVGGQGRYLKHILLVTFAWSLLAACSDDASTGSSSGAGGSGGASSSGTGAAGGELGSEDFLEPAQYDCSTAEPNPDPPMRPYAFGCVHEAACTDRFVTAHRMGNPFAPENSLAALRSSILLGADIVETDVRLTSDGEVVLIHDAEVDRTLSGSGNVEDFTLAELQEMTVDLELTDPEGDFACERIVTLDEVMALAEGRIVVEFETKRTEAGVATAQYLQANDLYGSAYVQCDLAECTAVRAAVADVPISLRVQAMSDLDAADAFDPPPIIYEVDEGSEFTEQEVLDRIHATGAKVFTNAFFSADITAFLGDVSMYEPIYALGIDIVQTEFPHLALYALGRLEPTSAP